jgi:RIO kinase 1
MMDTPDRLGALTDEGILQDVVRPLMSGKEAQVYLVISEGEPRVAKVYKEANDRSFKQRAEYTEGRTVRNSRDQRAMAKRSKHGRAQDEAAWRSAEVDMIYRLRDAGVRVPVPYHFIDGILIMELVTDADGNPAPRLGDLTLDASAATRIFEHLLAEVVRMLAAGVVHGDLSDFNVLMGVDGPVIIDFPQSVNAANNQNAKKLLARDVDNLHRFLARFAPGRPALPYAQEMWQLYERGELRADTQLTGRYTAPAHQANAHAVLDIVADAQRDERRRRERLGLPMHGMDREQYGGRPGDNRSQRQGQRQQHQRPQQSHNQQRPEQGQHHQRPQQGQHHQRPQQGQHHQRPPQGQHHQRPPQGQQQRTQQGQQQRPQQNQHHGAPPGPSQALSATSDSAQPRSDGPGPSGGRRRRRRRRR